MTQLIINGKITDAIRTDVKARRVIPDLAGFRQIFEGDTLLGYECAICLKPVTPQEMGDIRGAFRLYYSEQYVHGYCRDRELDPMMDYLKKLFTEQKVSVGRRKLEDIVVRLLNRYKRVYR